MGCKSRHIRGREWPWVKALEEPPYWLAAGNSQRGQDSSGRRAPRWCRVRERRPQDKGSQKGMSRSATGSQWGEGGSSPHPIQSLVQELQRPGQQCHISPSCSSIFHREFRGQGKTGSRAQSRPFPFYSTKPAGGTRSTRNPREGEVRGLGLPWRPYHINV